MQSSVHGLRELDAGFLGLKIRVHGARRPRKQMPNDPIQAMEFAQSKGQARKDGRTGVTFADVAGADEAVRQLQFVVEVHPASHKTLQTLNPNAARSLYHLLCQSHRAHSPCCAAV